jgi:hypothetical protein
MTLPTDMSFLEENQCIIENQYFIPMMKDQLGIDQIESLRIQPEKRKEIVMKCCKPFKEITI